MDSKLDRFGLEKTVSAIGECRVEPVLNTVQAASEGADLRVMGYHLFGPRGNKKTIFTDEDGKVSRAEVELWRDGVQYSTNKIAKRNVAKRNVAKRTGAA